MASASGAQNYEHIILDIADRTSHSYQIMVHYERPVAAAARIEETGSRIDQDDSPSSHPEKIQETATM